MTATSTVAAIRNLPMRFIAVRFLPHPRAAAAGHGAPAPPTATRADGQAVLHNSGLRLAVRAAIPDGAMARARRRRLGPHPAES